MEEVGGILDLLKNNSPFMILLVLLLSFITVYINKRIEGVAGRVEEIGKTSLAIKKDLRGEEREILVNFRAAVEEWEDFLTTAVFEFTMMDPLKADILELAREDKRLFLAVKIANVKACTYLRNQDLEKRLGDIILQIRHIYYPLINEAILKLIDLQAELKQKEGKEQAKIQTLMTAELKEFSDNLINQYRTIAEPMDELKETINHYIYRPIKETDIDKD
jgi:hypothetical protein